MATIRKVVEINISPARAWDALRDVGALHTKLCPSFVTDTKLEDGARMVTFANGMKARELIVDVDGKARRLVWAARNERLEHHNASLQVFDIDGLASCRVVWIADVLPHAAAQIVGGLMDEGLACMRKTLASHSGA